MIIGIIYHKENKQKIINYLKEYVFSNAKLEIDKNRIVFIDNENIYSFYTVDYMEYYKYSGICFNICYYPNSEIENKNLISVLNVCTRGINSLMFKRNFPCIFQYNENIWNENGE